MNRQYNNEDRDSSKKIRNVVVEVSKRVQQGYIVAVNEQLAINYPNVKRTRSGKIYIEHKEVQRQSIHPSCFCQERTYLHPNDDYLECEHCKEIHYISCDLLPFDEVEEFRSPLLQKCLHCLYNTRSLENRH